MGAATSPRTPVACTAAAARLLRHAQGPLGSPLSVSVTGAGGTGKSALLGALAQSLAGTVPVTLGLPESPPPDGAAVLVDDAHTLGPDELAALTDLVRGGAHHVVVAHRPWPQPPELRRLVAATEEHHAPVALGPLTVEEVADYAAQVSGRPLARDAVTELHHLTGGMPWLLHRVASAWEPGAGPPPDVVPREVLDQLAIELEHLDPDLRDLLQHMAVGFDLGEIPGPTAGRPTVTAGGSPAAAPEDAVTRARSDGLLLPDLTAVPLVRAAVLATTSPHHVQDLRRELVDAMTRSGRVIDADLARELARSGVRHPGVAHVLLAAGDDAVGSRPRLAGQLYEEAAAAGAGGPATAARRARAALAAGDLDTAGRVVDDLLTLENPPDLALAVDVAAAVWSQRGMLLRGAELYRWLGPERVGGSAPVAAVTMMGSGDLAGAEQMLAACTGHGTPTMLTVATRLMAEGLHCSLTGSSTRALSMLLRASDTLNASGEVPPLPILPASLAALVALQDAEATVAASVLDDALRAGQGGPGMKPRLLLGRAWVAMLHDHSAQAAGALAEARTHRLNTRDACFAMALDVGIARRSDDLPALAAAWRRAREKLLHCPLDLFLLQAVAEMHVASARLREPGWLEPHLADAWALLDSLGHPALWAVPLHWAAVQAAILSERPDDLRPHAAAVVRAAATNRLAAALAPAGRAWVHVLAGSVDVAAVEAASTGLARAGLVWDGARLAGHAAARADERRDQARLLTLARAMHPTSGRLPDAVSAGSAPEAIGDSMLSAREREVATMVLAGRTYREIGEALYISPRTAEHHVARIRRRLGAATRADLLVKLRDELEEQDA